jgi:hypothetical protein
MVSPSGAKATEGFLFLAPFLSSAEAQTGPDGLSMFELVQAPRRHYSQQFVKVIIFVKT